jgi:phosphatidylserine/phosphatidylglycerophosphate/cardiolipin synthase-like enzyme
MPAMSKVYRLALAAALVAAALPAAARKPKASLIDKAVAAYQDSHSYSIPAAGTIEVAFSPNEGSEHLVVKVIDSARCEVRVLAYSFTSAPVTEALVRARHRTAAGDCPSDERGRPIDVRVVADAKENISQDRSGKARAALGALPAAGADVRTISVYPIHHDKVVIADGQTVELGSFNYSAAAAHSNSENVMVNWGNPKLASVYLEHFARNYAQAQPFTAAYQ